VSLLVDTSVWSLAFRRDSRAKHPAVDRLHSALERDEEVFATGIVLQELLQGFSGPKQRARLIEHFEALPFVVPTRDDHVEAATVRNRCRAKGVQLGTIDALLVRLCLDRRLELLTTDRDFAHASRVVPLRLAVRP
jgi:predicted nucleic acid-binding protein